MHQKFSSAALAVASTAVVALGCVEESRFVPGPGVPTTPKGTGAIEQAAGVEVILQPNAWTGYPSNLGNTVTPMHVTIENRSAHPLRVRYRELTLRSADGKVYRAIPPFHIKGSAALAPTTVRPELREDRYQIAPSYGPIYPGLAVWSGPFDSDFEYQEKLYEIWRPELPTQSMLTSALPEGVVPADGRVSGFVYFERVDPESTTSVHFQLELIDAKTNERFGTIDVLLLAESVG